MFVVIILLAIVIVVVVYFALQPQPQEPQQRKYTLDELEQAPISVISTMPQGGALGVMTKHGVVYNYSQQRPSFTHTINSYYSCAYLITFLELADKAGIFKLSLFQEAMGFKQNTTGWDFAKKVKDMTAPAASVAIPLTLGTVLSTGALLAAPVAAIAGLLGILGGLDSEVKKRIAESQACNVFIEEFVKAYGLPPTGLLNAQSALWIGANYGVIKGTSKGGALDRTDEFGVGIISSMAKLATILATRERILHGVGNLGNGDAYRQLVNSWKVRVVLDGNQSMLKKSRLSPKWTRYCFSYEHLVANSYRLKWPKDPVESIETAIRSTYQRTGNPFLFDRQSMVSWMENGGVFKGYLGSNPNPSALFFTIGHDPGIDGYGGIDWSLFGVAPQTEPNIAENDWKVIFEIDTVGGWMHVY